MDRGRFGVSTTHKALVMLTAKASQKPALIEDCKPLARKLLGKLPDRNRRVTLMAAIDRDPFKLFSAVPGYDATIELRADTAADLIAVLEGLVQDLPATACSEPSASVVLVGDEHVFRPAAAPQPVCYQFLMRRRSDLTHETYAEHYGNIHSGFGLKTRGVKGYAQFHVDPQASRETVKLSGLGSCDFDGVSQLYLSSLSAFVLAMPINATIGAAQDEENFINRKASSMFSSRVIHRW